jgi:hypothetical protein
MHVQNAGTAVFGSSTKINLQFSNLDIKARKWYEFINRVMQDEEQFEERTDSRSTARKGAIELYGWRLDSFFEVLGADTVEYEDKSAEKTEEQPIAPSRRKKRQPSARQVADVAQQGSMQLSMFQLDDPVLVQIRDQIKGLDINSLTPLEALNKLNEIKKITGL